MASARTCQRVTPGRRTIAIVIAGLALGGCFEIVGPEGPGPVTAYRLQGTVSDLEGRPVEGVQVGVSYRICFGFGCDAPRYLLGPPTGPDGRFDVELEPPFPMGEEWNCGSEPRALGVRALPDSTTWDVGPHVECADEVQTFHLRGSGSGGYYVDS